MRNFAATAMLIALAATPAAARTISVSPSGNAQEALQEALLDAKPGDVVAIAAGRYDLTDGLSLDVSGVTVRGAGPDKTVLSFKGQQGAGEGLLVTSDDVVLRGFAIEDSKGDGIKSKGADRIVYKDIRVEWTGGPKETNGAYGIYPVESKSVLVDGGMVRGASDAGIYVGQSEDIIVRNSIVEQNVAGIEIENSRHADVYGNTATRNTGGILVFDLPNLPRGNGGDVRVYGNTVVDNDTPNFAPKGNIVAQVPKGTGVLVMANDGVFITDNALAKNATANVMIVSYRNPYQDAKYNPLPRNVVVAKNTHGPAGFAPGLPGGEQLAAAMGGAIPAVLWDGTGDANSLTVSDSKVLSLGLKAGEAPTNARPTPVDLQRTPAALRAPVVLPAAMEAAAK
ncbi:parallel beta-helix domain-containing protein [uncultured Sphingomonas sp.]|uniref:parallel beta-helix domain-containing protein n=1 Tax=Sphingomonas sp. 179-A 2A2 NHS TaxID=3374290 RepID=UPI0025DE310E|nr:parallel beta-helix domain-containing protein [uncultured Sphingomonas sp.]